MTDIAVGTGDASGHIATIQMHLEPATVVHRWVSNTQHCTMVSIPSPGLNDRVLTDAVRGPMHDGFVAIGDNRPYNVALITLDPEYDSGT